jgi:hypothetical protein
MARVFKADIRRDTRCESCGTEYFYIQALEVTEGDSSRFDAKIEKAVATGVEAVPCPECGRLTAEMHRQRRRDLLVTLASVAGMAFAGLIVFGALEEGTLLYGLAILAGLAGIYYVLQLLAWPFAPRFKRKFAIRPGREDEAHPEAKARLEVWRAGQRPDASL